jgi:hypothetical protein
VNQPQKTSPPRLRPWERAWVDRLPDEKLMRLVRQLVDVERAVAHGHFSATTKTIETTEGLE